MVEKSWRSLSPGVGVTQKQEERPAFVQTRVVRPVFIQTSVVRPVFVHGYLGYKKPELKKPYRIWPPRFLNLRKRGPTGFFHVFLNLRKRGPTDVGAPGFL